MLIVKCLIATGLLLAVVMGGLKLVRLRRWTRGEAVCLGIDREKSTWLLTKYKLSFCTTDGEQIIVTRHADPETGVPRKGSNVAIIYDPRKPERAEEDASPVGVLAASAVAFALIVAIILY